MKNFFKRRLIRLHPMVIMGAVLGAITFCLQGCVQWDGTHIALSMIMLSLLCTIFLFPQCQVQVMKSVVMAKCFL